MLPDEFLPPLRRADVIGDEWQVGDTVELDACEVSISQPSSLKLDVDPRGDDPQLALWTAVCWARSAGIPGTWKEHVQLDEHTFRLGALYRLARFELREREANYCEYGERPEYDV